MGNYQKTAVYETFQASPIYEEPYTAQDFNAGLPGYDGNGAGYITYFYWRNMQLKNASGNLTTPLRTRLLQDPGGHLGLWRHDPGHL